MKSSILATLALCCLASCQHMSWEDEDMETRRQFTFTVKGDFVNPEFTRANTYMTADGAEMTDLWVIDYKDGEIKQELHQASTDADWGAPKMSLTLGTHHIYFLASRGTEPVYQAGRVKWSKVLDTFYKDYEVTVVKTSNGNRAVTLDRVASKLTIYIDDAIESGTTGISIAPSTWYTGYDMIASSPILADNYSVSFPLNSTYAGKKGLSLSAWTVSAGQEWTTSVSIESHTASGNNAEVTIPDVPMLANRITTYHGSLYSNASESSISLNADWLTGYDGVY